VPAVTPPSEYRDRPAGPLLPMSIDPQPMVASALHGKTRFWATVHAAA
jgi:hypothetical protein